LEVPTDIFYASPISLMKSPAM